MIRLGFDDDDESLEELDESGNPVVKHGETFDVNERKMTVYLPEKQINRIKDSYDCVVVNEFGDEYHLSEEERAAKNKFYEAFKRFSKCKHKYRRLDEYISAMREALKCLDFVSENNGVYDPDEFKKLFFRNKIYVTGLKFPEFKGREKKNISWEYLTDFILSDEDPKNILPKKADNIYTEEDIETMQERLFDPDELDRIVAPDTEDDEFEKDKFFDVEEDSQDDKNVVVFLSNKESRKFIKAQPEFLFEIKEMKRENKKIDNLSRFVYDLTSEDIESIAAYDQEHNYKSDSDMPVFKGDMTNDDDYNKYLFELKEWEENHIKDNYHGKLKTIDQIQELELKQVLENNNWNIRNLYGNKEKEEKLRKIQRKEKLREKELRKKLVEVTNRRKRHMGEDVDNTPKKKSKKKKDKKKKSKTIDHYKKEVKSDIDDLLLGTVDRLDGDFHDYKEDIADWSWDSIVKEGDK